MFISNFKLFKCKYPPQRIPFTNEYGDNIQFMMLSGYNGYGKTSIFQAIEFVLNGRIEIFRFKDTTKKYTEHISINELNKESLLVLDVVNKLSNQCISIIRYNECVKPCDEKECMGEFKNFELFILNRSFDYDVFKQKRRNKEIKSTTTNELARILNEKNLNEWLATNYLKQEQSLSFLFKSNSDRVSFINQFIDNNYEEYFSKFYHEDEKLNNEIKKMTTKLNSLKDSINKNQIKSIGEKPCNLVLFKDQDIIWDKEDYKIEEDFETYLEGIRALKEIYNKLDIYVATDKINGIKKIINEPELLKKVLIFSCFKGQIATYINEYKRKQHLIDISVDKESMLSKKMDTLHFDDKIIRRISALKKKAMNADELAGNKQKIYMKIKNIREQAKSNIKLVNALFDEECPLCGHNYKNEKLKLVQAIERHNDVFRGISKLLDDNNTFILESIDIEFYDLKKDIESIISSINIEKQMYNYLVSINEKINRFNKLEERLNYLLNDNIKDYTKDLKLNVLSLNNISNELVRKLEILSKDHLKKIKEKPLDGSEMLNLKENHKYLLILIKNSNDKLLSNIEQKELLFKWYLAKKQFENYSKEMSMYNESYIELKEMHIQSRKIKKLLKSIKSSKDNYMNDLVRYIEIPLYIYSGKLMQTHQNGLGVFCTTGSSKDKVTQFKLTTNGDASGHDIVNKFSSGQKAIINIAVILAFRKIRTSSLDLFMIDDPCQSMDDINISSLTEILRNEFRSSQILISSHDDSIAGYMCYKYYKSGRTYRNLNVQKELYKFLDS